MLGGRIRNGKPRIFVFSFVGIVMLLGIFVLRDTHVKLNTARTTLEHCEQQQESLSAQLQVVYEHKSRLEKSLQQEKALHKKDKDEILAQYQELQDVKEKEKQESGNRFNSVQQQQKMLQIQNEDLQEELNKVQQSNIRLMQEKQQLQDSLDGNEDAFKQKDLDNAELKAKILTLQQEIQTLSKDISVKDTKLKALAVHVDLCDAKLKTMHLDKLSLKQGTDVIVVGKGKPVITGEHKLERKVNMPDHEEPESLVAKLDASKDSTLKIRNFNKDKSIGISNYQNIHNIHGSSDALPMGMGRRTGQLGHPLEPPNNIPLEESLGAAQQLAVPDTRNLNQKSYEHEDAAAKIPVGRVEEFQGNGLEQQENGGDQDLDNMEEDGAGGHPPKEEKEDGKAFDDADFDQVPDDGGDTVKKGDPRQEVIAAVPP